MKIIKYEFVDGETKDVEVSEEFYEQYTEMEKETEKNERKETRRHVSLEYLMEQGVDFPEEEFSMPNILDDFENGEFAKAIKNLSARQQKLLFQLYVEGYTLTEIAEVEGRDKSAIRHRLERIFEKIKKSLI